MQIIGIQVAFLLIFGHVVKAKLSDCEEIKNNQIAIKRIKFLTKRLPYENKIKEAYEAFDKNDTDRMNSVLRSLKDIVETIEISQSDDIPVLSVVCF